MKTKSYSDIIVSLTSLVSYFKQYVYNFKVIFSDHESAFMSATSFINQQGIQYHTMTPYQDEKIGKICSNKKWKVKFSAIKSKVQASE